MPYFSSLADENRHFSQPFVSIRHNFLFSFQMVLSLTSDSSHMCWLVFYWILKDPRQITWVISLVWFSPLWWCVLQKLSALFSLDSQVLLNSGNSPGSTSVPPLCAVPWKLSQGSMLGQLQGSPHLFCSQGSLFFIVWHTGSWKSFFSSCIFCFCLFDLGMRVNPTSLTPSWLKEVTGINL